MQRIVLAVVIVLALVPVRANAATIVFDMCTVASLCNLLELHTTLQPGGEIDVSVPGNVAVIISPEGFGINYGSGVNVTLNSVPGPYIGPGEIGPYGFFEQRWDGPSVTGSNYFFATFRDVDGRFSSDLEPFFENSQGIFAAAHVRNQNTGETGFVAAELRNATPVPEPGTMLLLGSGLVAIFRRTRRR
ncbi:MAG TPA: PEP-CTERM sorting domain-containing protein [Vicinamibacterales bacterium]|nr:PEP-CTERM sorting domain-containing protein [Vicinamibacterales bacterium]